MNSRSTPPRSRLASRKPEALTNLKIESNPLLAHVVTSDRASIPCCKSTLEDIDSSLKAIKEFFLPLGGDNFDVRDLNGRTALHEAAQAGHEAVVEYLVQHGADIYAEDEQGRTPLDLAKNHSLTKIMLKKKKQEHVREEENASKNRKNDAFKWVIAILNVGIELLQAILSQEASNWEIKATCYRRLGVALASICLMVSGFDMISEAKRDRVEFKRRRGCYWLYYPGREGRAFGRVMLWFSLVSSILQLCLNLASLKIKKAILKFDHTSLLLSICYLFARFGCRRRMMRGIVKCGEHRDSQIEL